MPQKIGLLTFHHVQNEGAILQAYALSRKLQEVFAGDTVEVIDYRPRRTVIRDRNHLFEAIARPRDLLQRIRRRSTLHAFIDRQLPLGKQRLISDDCSEAVDFLNRDYDAIVVGSDEVWKCEARKYSRPFPNVYWLPPELRCVKFAYAASANKTKYRDLGAGHAEWIRESLARFASIGVRDTHTIELLRHVGAYDETRVRLVPDPTLLCEFEQDVRERLEQLGVDFRRRRLITTFHDERITPGLLEHFRRRGFQTLSVSNQNRYVDLDLSGRLDPLEWAGLFRHADLCLSNLFHGSLFCIKSGTPFLGFDYFARGGYRSKLGELLDQFGIRASSYVDAKDPALEVGELQRRAEGLLETGRIDRARLQRIKAEGEAYLREIREMSSDLAQGRR